MALAVSAVLFLIFATNVVMGSSTGTTFLGDVSEMLVLFAASIAFVAAILRRETRAKEKNTQ